MTLFADARISVHRSRLPLHAAARVPFLHVDAADNFSIRFFWPLNNDYGVSERYILTFVKKHVSSNFLLVSITIHAEKGR